MVQVLDLELGSRSGGAGDFAHYLDGKILPGSIDR
jgi:hypothetical protein